MTLGSDPINIEADERFRAMAEATPTPVWMTAPTGGIVYANRAFTEMVGLSAERLAGDVWLSLIHPDDVAAIAASRDLAFVEGHQPYDFSARFRDASGAWRWMHASGQPRFDPDGAFRGYVGIAVDETPARRAEAELRASEARLRMVQEAGGIGSLEWDLRTGVVHRSPQYLALQGLPADHPQTGPLDDEWVERIHPDDRQAVIATLNDAIANSGAFERAYRTVRADTGETRWLLVRGRVEADAAGKATRLLSAQSDITEHRVAEGQLRELNERLEERAREKAIALADEIIKREAAEASSEIAVEHFRLLVQGVTDYALYMLTPEGNVATWNSGAQSIKGYRADEIVGQHFSRFYTDDDRAAGAPAKALDTARTTGRFENTAWRLRKDGSRFLANIVIDAIHDDAGTLIGFAKITRDVTEQREAQRELEETREALVQAQKMEMVGQLTGGLAHDFNNMLAGIIGALNLMQRRIAAGRHDEIERYIEAALASANRAASLTSRLLAFGRRASLDIKPVDVAAAVSSMEILLTRSIGENIKLNLDLGPALALTDANQLESAVLNLAVNARDAMPDGGVLDISTRIDASGLVGIAVTDTGVGMSRDVLDKVFDPFFTTKPIGQGTGLGLSMVHGFAKQSGGDVRIESAPGAGTTVTMLLPRATEVAVSEAKQAVGETAGAGETVLVVEDDPQVRMLVLEILDDLGYAALEASDAREALTLLDQEHVDLLVSDVGLPGMNGRQLAEMARARLPHLRVLFMTGYAEHAKVRSSFLGEDMDLIAKPFEIDDLAMKIRAMVSRERA